MKHLLLVIVFLLTSSHAEEKDSAWQPLFDGKSLSGWIGVDGKAVNPLWKVEGDVLHLTGKGGNIISVKEFSSFELEWEWKIESGGNNGVKYWVNQHGKEWLGIEYQMIDDGVNADGKGNHTTASFYDIKAAVEENKPIKKAGEWNVSKVICKKGVLQHFLNGKLVCEIDTKSNEWNSAIAASKFKKVKGFAPQKGRIMLTEHSSQAWYKNIRIRALAE